MKKLRIASGLVLLAGLTAGARADEPGARLHQLLRERFEWQLREYPEQAMARGDYSNAEKVTDHSLAAIERRHGETRAFAERLGKIDPSELSANDRLSYDLFGLNLRNAIEGHRFRMFLAPITGRSGPHQRIGQMHERVRFTGYDDYANYLTRLEQVPRSIADTIAAMRLGLAERRTPPKVAILGVPGQTRALLAGGLNALAGPFERMPARITPSQRTELKRRFDTRSMPAVRGAIKLFSAFLTDEYVPNCRETIAAHDLPDGQAYYAFQLRVMTTTNLTAREIHDLGLSEVKRIRAEMMSVIRASDFMEVNPSAATLDHEALFKAFIHYLRTDPRFYHATEQELLAGYRDICKRVDAILPKLFKTLPRLPYGVRKIPDFMAPNQTTAYYSRGDIRNAQPGYFYANTYALDQRPKYEMVALAMHEAVPGHHFQVAISQELTNVPELRKNSWFTAFGEGWALYSERLGLEHGLYDDPYDNFGRLLYEMWRACRLVVDPGMHALGWSRDKAVRFLLDNTALSEVNIDAEVDRYIAWPGQATGYKIGELKIRELRARAEEKLGERFDLREFHDVVLGAGSIPLTVLERRIDAWVSALTAAEQESGSP
ncbi:MAG: DUF885 domain-containing protein [Planctomycetes bacterium]|nr:DUF885 domain-containing protein [Planctomycetota bacterium]